MRIQLCVALLAVGFLSACSGAGNSASGSSGTPSSQAATGTGSGQVNIAQVQAEAASAQTSLQNAQSALGTIFSSNGSINWDVLLGGGVDFSSMGASTQACLQAAFPNSNPVNMIFNGPTEVSQGLACVLNDVVSVAGIANTDLNNALAILNASLASAPAGSDAATEIQAMITQVQTLQAEYTTEVKALASQLNVVTNFLNSVPSLAGSALSGIPIAGLLVNFTLEEYLQPVIVEIQSFQTQMETI